jgi:hypothetical protein
MLYTQALFLGAWVGGHMQILTLEGGHPVRSGMVEQSYM